MAQSEPILCPDCGWSGPKSKLDREGEDDNCPICAEAIEFVE